MLDTEQLVIAATLQAGTVPEEIDADNFRNAWHQKVWQAIKLLPENKINVLALYDQLNTLGLSGLGGGIAQLSGWSGIDLGGEPKKVLKIASKELVSQQAKLAVAPSVVRHTGATYLDTTVDESKAEAIKTKLYTTKIVKDKKTGMEYEATVLHSDWYIRLIDADPEIKHCIKYDYTVGTPVIAYSDTSLFRAALIRRLRSYVPMEKITDTIVDRIIGEVKLNNSNYNRVAAFVDDLKHKHPNTTDKVLDYLMRLIKFADVEEIGQTALVKYYREVFHIFFLRMHLHIQGTRKTGTGDYHGLMTNDIVPILRGDQNLGKTTFCQWLACGREDMYVDLGSGGRGGFGTEETVRQVRGRMIAELGEMWIMRNGESVEMCKSFISKDKYELNVKYVEYSNPIPSTISYIGSSNTPEFLSDTTGNRRFYPINVEWIDKEGLSAQKDLAEKIHAHYARLAEKIAKKDRYSACCPSPELVAWMESKRDDSMIRYNDFTAIIRAAARLYDDAKASVERDVREKYHKVTDDQIDKALGDMGYKFRASKNAVKQAMPKAGYEHATVSIHGVKVRGWKKLFDDADKFSGPVKSVQHSSDDIF